jgi:hypothetical protein
MMTTLTEALNNGNEATAQEALELLIELAGTQMMKTFYGKCFTSKQTEPK